MMRCYVWPMLVLAMMFLFERNNINVFRGCSACMEEERDALLQIKASIIDVQYPAGFRPKSDVLASWDVTKSSNCCHWEGVECTNTTGRVFELHLSSLWPWSNDDDGSHKYWLYLNASLFLPFQELQFLDLSSNSFYGTLEDEGFERLRALKKLEVLDLGSNNLDNGILPSIFAITSLKKLNLWGNSRIEGLTHFEDIKNLSKLEFLGLRGIPLKSWRILDYLDELPMLKMLHLGGCQLSDSLISSAGVKKLTKLEELYLESNGLDWTIWDSLGELPNVKILDLRGNNLNGNGTGSGKGFKKLTKLKKLDLQSNGLDWTIWDSLGELPNLKTLDLSYNNLNGNATISGKGVKKLIRLQELRLSKTSLDWKIWDSLGALSNLTILDLSDHGIVDVRALDWKISDSLGAFPNLKVLNLRDNDIVDVRALQPLGKLQQLEKLYLSSNNFNGPLLDQSGGLCSLKKLEQLDLRSCHQQGTLPPCLGNLTSLRYLDLSDNLFEGNIASSPIVNLVSLEELFLSHNKFQSLDPFSSFANHSKLTRFELINDGSTGDLVVETERPTNWVPTFQLQSLHLESCKVNTPTGVFPRFLYHQMELEWLSLAKSSLVAEFPSWLLKNNTKLEILDLQENRFTGTLQELPHHSRLQELVASNNRIQGYIPTDVGKLLANLELLMMQSNSLEGGIPSSFGDMHQLEILDLSFNSLSGEIPEKLARGSSLTCLNLSGNSLSGQIFPTFSGASSIRYLYLAGNHFTGHIPATLPNKQSLQVLDIRNNSITGLLPNWIGEMESLSVLLLSKNHLSGSIPRSICRLELLESLDLSNNNITGPIPSCFSPPNIKYVNFRGNGLTGMLDHASSAIFASSSQLMVLDVGDNDITGNIPWWIANRLPELRILVLKRNRLRGNLPTQICHLHEIRMIDLSFNIFSGPIPSCLATLTFNLNSDSVEQFRDPWENSINSTYSLFGSLFGSLSVDTSDTISNYVYEHVEFVSKSRENVYEGKNLRFALGVDLSSNKLSGNIPPEIGNLNLIHTLNLSHNYLTGAIPSTFSNLKSIESLDLSYNNLVGPIPTELVELNFLSNFSVAHNNLSGKTPERIAQFATFEENSYGGNPFLCGPPLKKNCSTTTTRPSSSTTTSDDSSTSLAAFYASFAGAFVVGFIGVLVFLFINPYWRRIWFRMIDRGISAVEYILIDIFYKLKHLVCG